MIKYVVFDLDGTLLDTLEDLRDSVNYVLSKHGYEEHTLEEIRSFVGNGVGKLIKRSLPADVGEEEYNHILGEFRTYYTEHCNIKTKPYAGITDLISQLKKAGIKSAIVSNKNDKAVKELAEIYFPGLLETAVGECEGIKRKPAPDSVFHVLRQMGGDISKAVYIGDSEVDFETSDNAGLPCILVDWGFRDRVLLKSFRAYKVVSSVEELYHVLKEM